MGRNGQPQKQWHYRTEEGRIIEETLAKTFEKLLKQVGDNKNHRQMICEYTLGYMGATYGLYVA